MKTARATFLAIGALVLMVLGAAAQTKRPPTLEEYLSFERITDPVISPDGRFVAYSVTETSWTENDYITQLWLADTSGSRTFQLTRDKKSTGAAQWSPDGQWLAFIGEREPNANTEPEKKKDAAEGKPASRQIWLISPLGGEAWQLTRHERPVGNFRWSPDGKQIAFAAGQPESKVAKERKEKYSDFQVFEQDYIQNQLWLVDVAAAEKTTSPARATQLTRDLSLNVTEFDWSPDSKRIAFTGLADPLLAFSSESDIYLLDVGGGTVQKVIALPGSDHRPVFSPDGQQLAFVSMLGRKYPYLTSRIAVVDLEAVQARPATQAADVRDLTASFDENPQLIDWGPDGIYFTAPQRTAAHVFRLDPAKGAITCLTSPENYVAEGVSFTRDFKKMAVASSDAEHMSEVYVSPTALFKPRKLTDITAQSKNFTFGSVEVVSWESGDGTTIEGVLRKPADYDPAKKYALLVIIHGGPMGAVRALRISNDRAADHAYPYQLFLAKGALILEPNYRGSGAYGEKFRSLNVRNLGVGDMMDVMSGADALIAKGMVDPQRLGAMGWSQGGYISAFLTTHTDRFRAISVGAGISDWMTYYVNTDMTLFTRDYLLATPWDDPEIYARTSPITNIKQAKTPTLIQHGEGDNRVPVPDAFELYRGLRDQNVPARLLLYTGFGHVVTRPKSNRAVLQSNLDWFSHYIWGEPIPKDSPLLGSGETEVAK